MKVYKGSIVTCDKEDNVFRYLVEDGGKIVYVGNELPGDYASAETEDLEGKALIPTFADTHSHFASYAVFATAVMVKDAKSISEIQDILKTADIHI
jgi:predicted amidohydrolase YtcJ